MESYRGLIFVSFDREVEDLVDYLAGARAYIDAMMDAAEVAASFSANGEGVRRQRRLARRLVGPARRCSAGRISYGIKANWKLLVENSFDGYHLGPTHATYFQFLKDQNVDVSPSTGTMKLLGNGHAVIEYSGSWGRPIARWAAQFGDESRAQLEALRERIIDELGDTGYRMAELNRNLFIYPNLFVMDNNATALRVIEPTAVDYMDVAQYELAPRDRRSDGEKGQARELRHLRRAGRAGDSRTTSRRSSRASRGRPQVSSGACSRAATSARSRRCRASCRCACSGGGGRSSCSPASWSRREPA